MSQRDPLATDPRLGPVAFHEDPTLPVDDTSARLRVYAETLYFYADPRCYTPPASGRLAFVLEDGGRLAREALGVEEGCSSRLRVYEAALRRIKSGDHPFRAESLIAAAALAWQPEGDRDAGTE